MCAEKRKVGQKNVASLEPLPQKFATISADGGKWRHPQTGIESEFVCIIDEGSRFRTARVLKHGRKQTMSSHDFLGYLQEGWSQYFGFPQSLRVHPAGAFRSREVERFCDEHSIYLDITPGEAHWQLGVCEQAIQGLKSVMSRIAEDPEDHPVDRSKGGHPCRGCQVLQHARDGPRFLANPARSREGTGRDREIRRKPCQGEAGAFHRSDDTIRRGPRGATAGSRKGLDRVAVSSTCY